MTRLDRFLISETFEKGYAMLFTGKNTKCITAVFTASLLQNPINVATGGFQQPSGTGK